MNRNTWIKKLRKALNNYPAHLVDEIIEDYQEHFENGLYQGKSEEEIARELGNPKDVAKEYLGDKNISFWDQVRSNRILNIIIFIIFVVGLITIFPYAVNVTSSLIKGVLWLILFVIGVGLIVTFGIIYYLKRKFGETFKFVQTSSPLSDVYQYRQHTAMGIERIVIDSSLSNVTVKTTKENIISATLEGQSNIEASDLTMERNDDTLYIKSETEKGTYIHKNTNISLTLTINIPDEKQYDIEVKSNMGSVNIEPETSKLKVKSMMGSLKIYGQQNEIDLSTSMGSIKLYHFDGHGRIKSSMGSINFMDSDYLSATLEINLSMGSLKVLNDRFIKEQLSKKRVRIQGTQPSKTIHISSSMGNVKIK